MDDEQFSAARLRGYRHALRRTQGDVAAVIGRDWATVKGYECGDRRPTPTTRRMICDYFGIAPDALSPRFTEADADYVDAVAAVGGLDLDATTLQTATALFALVGRLRGRSARAVVAPR